MQKLLLFCLLTFSGYLQAADYLLFYLGGQSNMEGFGYSGELPEYYQGTENDVLIFNGNAVGDDQAGGGFGQWLPLSPGFGTGIKSTDSATTLSNRFGPELSFGKHMAKLTGKKIAIIKYARGGSSIALGASGYGTWDRNYQENTGINQWDNFQATVAHALSDRDIDNDGIEDTLLPSGIIWMQGEADAYVEFASKVYEQNLRTLMQHMSDVFGAKQLPIVIGRIEDWGNTEQTRIMKYIDAVWAAQAEFAAENPHVEYVKFSEPVEFLDDKWHYQSKHYLQLGKLFADAAFKQLDRKD